MGDIKDYDESYKEDSDDDESSAGSMSKASSEEEGNDVSNENKHPSIPPKKKKRKIEQKSNPSKKSKSVEIDPESIPDSVRQALQNEALTLARATEEEASRRKLDDALAEVAEEEKRLLLEEKNKDELYTEVYKFYFKLHHEDLINERVGHDRIRGIDSPTDRVSDYAS